MRSRRALVGALAFVAFLVLGALVSHGPPGAFDLLAQGERARFPGLALFLTRSGLAPVYVAICVIALAFGLVRRAYLWAASILIAEVIGTWLASDAFKELFRRARPEYFYSIHETSYAYASGHAALSLACYGFITYVVWHASVAQIIKRIVAIASGMWILAIGWSRLSLGAHFPTDLIGGYLLATATLAIATAAYDRTSLARGVEDASAALPNASVWR